MSSTLSQLAATVTPAVITIDIPPTFDIGPITLAWHGLTIALGILIGGLLAGRLARSRGLPVEPLNVIILLVIASALVGGRVYYLAETGRLLEPSRWLAMNGFTFYGGFIMAAVTIAIYLRRSGHGGAYLDVCAVALPLGIAIGRIGDVINGEHYGAQSDFLLAVRNAHPDALTPNPELAYHNGGLYEVILGLAIFAIVWPLRDRLRRRATATTWLVLALFAAGRFIEFFLRNDSQHVAAGLNSAQWTSIFLLAVAAVGAWWTLLRHPHPPRRGR
ncbi:MAG TPA: prolipoprotein diacylglyceryl transferase family protein [Solirubrobacteraceae bacterium]|nr:prolipoprotein diacylglyceryl transferase family protein [Solirubrobacteraceae bacterium]